MMRHRSDILGDLPKMCRICRKRDLEVPFWQSDDGFHIADVRCGRAKVCKRYRAWLRIKLGIAYAKKWFWELVQNFCNAMLDLVSRPKDQC